MRLLTLVVLSLLAAVLGEGAPKVPAWNFALTLRVGPEEWDQSITELEALLDLAKSTAMSAHMQLFLRGTLEKVKEKETELHAAQAQKAEQARAAAEAPPALLFTDKAVEVKPLKGSMAARKDTIQRYPVAEALRLARTGKLDFRKPFIIQDGVPERGALLAKLTASELMMLTDVRINYLSPVIAKKKRSFEETAQEEEFEFQRITFEDWFKECFNLRARSDFRRMPGYGTEHCEQTVPSWLLPAGWANLSLATVAELQLDSLVRLGAAREAFLRTHLSALRPLLPEDREVFDAVGADAAQWLTMGSAGSGEQLRRYARPHLDALVAGRRRWIFLSSESFRRVRAEAKGVLEPASAFQFFEQQYEELREDFGLGGKAIPVVEGNQGPGDLLFIPPGMHRLALALEDSVSVTTEAMLPRPQALNNWVDEAIYHPSGGVVPTSFTALACFDFDLGTAMETIQGRAGFEEQFVSQLMRSNFGTPPRQTALAVSVLARCEGAKAMEGLFEATLCPRVWAPCQEVVEARAAALQIPAPQFRDVPSTELLTGGDEL